MRRPNALRRWAHQRGVARILNERYNGATGFEGAYVQTAAPISALARYAAGRYGLRVVSRERVGLLAWRWQLRRGGEA
jgi:hypothetical protein